VLLASAVALVHRPDPDTYVATFAREAYVAPGSEVIIRGHTLRYGVGAKGVFRVAAEANGTNGVACVLEGLRASVTVAYAAELEECPRVAVHADRRGDILVVYVQHAQDPTFALAAYDLREDGIVTLTPWLVGSRLAAPIGWTLDAAVGLAFAVPLLALARRARRRSAGVGGALEQGVHLGSGHVELVGGERVRVAAAERLAVGPVVLSRAPERATTYREPSAPAFTAVEQGTIEDVRGTARDRVASLEATALAIAVLGATPLAVAQIVLRL